MVGEEAGDRGDDAGPVRTGNGEAVELVASIGHFRTSPRNDQATPTAPPRRSSPAPSSAPAPLRRTACTPPKNMFLSGQRSTSANSRAREATAVSGKPGSRLSVP